MSAVDTSRLPENPRLWDFDFRGRRAGDKEAVLLEFLRDVYGPYLPQHKYEIREFIFRTDKKLYQAIKVYGFKNLPENLPMPSRSERLQDRLARAVKNYKAMKPSEKRSVQRVAHMAQSPGKAPR
jgi:hypothetical protein